MNHGRSAFQGLLGIDSDPGMRFAILRYGVAFKMIARRRGGGDAGVHHMLRRGGDDEANTVSA